MAAVTNAETLDKFLHLTWLDPDSQSCTLNSAAKTDGEETGGKFAVECWLLTQRFVTHSRQNNTSVSLFLKSNFTYFIPENKLHIKLEPQKQGQESHCLPYVLLFNGV
jgi:hypothetical protein